MIHPLYIYHTAASHSFLYSLSTSTLYFTLSCTFSSIPQFLYFFFYPLLYFITFPFILFLPKLVQSPFPSPSSNPILSLTLPFILFLRELVQSPLPSLSWYLTLSFTLISYFPLPHHPFPHPDSLSLCYITPPFTLNLPYSTASPFSSVSCCFTLPPPFPASHPHLLPSLLHYLCLITLILLLGPDHHLLSPPFTLLLSMHHHPVHLTLCLSLTPLRHPPSVSLCYATLSFTLSRLLPLRHPCVVPSPPPAHLLSPPGLCAPLHTFIRVPL